MPYTNWLSEQGPADTTVDAFFVMKTMGSAHGRYSQPMTARSGFLRSAAGPLSSVMEGTVLTSSQPIALKSHGKM